MSEKKIINDPTYLELKCVKEEINRFVEKKFNYLGGAQQSLMIYIAKKITFLKYVIRFDKNKYEYKALLSDLLYLISSIEKSELRYFYLNSRSLIEQSLRIINSISSSNTMSNKEMISKTKDLVLCEEQFFNGEIKFNLSVIENEYKKACRFVHGNSSANLPLLDIYEDIIKSNISNVDTLLSETEKLLDELFRLIICTNANGIDLTFFRRKSILKYLMNDEALKIIKEKCKD